jgi:ABC-type phosphate/phosphonate transport system substrate-binding protein
MSNLHGVFRLMVLSLMTVFSTASLAKEYVFSAPPRGPAVKEAAVYKPIADYLSRATGKTIVYKHPDNWLNYQNQMQKGNYDLVFDGPHFIGWRMDKVQHQPLARLPGKLSFVIFVKDDNKAVKRTDDLAGRTLCGLAPPNLATLTMYSQFPNPMRQPLVVEVKSFPAGYTKVMEGRCTAGVMRDKMFNKLQKQNSNKGRVIWSSNGTANQGFSAGPKFSDGDRARLASSLLSPDAKPHLDKFFDRFSKNNKALLPTNTQEYAGLGVLLRDVWGFEQ